jgi:hypothetical protein
MSDMTLGVAMRLGFHNGPAFCIEYEDTGYPGLAPYLNYGASDSCRQRQ